MGGLSGVLLPKTQAIFGEEGNATTWFVETEVNLFLFCHLFSILNFRLQIYTLRLIYDVFFNFKNQNKMMHKKGRLFWEI